MKNSTKIIIAVVGSGIIGGLVYSASLYPDLVGVFTAVGLLISGAMVKYIGWSPTK